MFAPIGLVFTLLVQGEVNLWPLHLGIFSFSSIIFPWPLFSFIGELYLCLVVNVLPLETCSSDKLPNQHQNYNSVNLARCVKATHLLTVHKAHWILFNLLSSQQATLLSNIVNCSWTQPITDINRHHYPRSKHRHVLWVGLQQQQWHYKIIGVFRLFGF